MHPGHRDRGSKAGEKHRPGPTVCVCKATLAGGTGAPPPGQEHGDRGVPAEEIEHGTERIAIR